MLEKILENLLSPKQWIRIVLMLFFALISWLVRFVQILIAVVQAICVLISGEENERLRTAGMVTSIYQAQIWLFLTYASDSKPFPMSDLPQDINDLDLNKDDVVYSYTPSESEEEVNESDDDVFSDMSFTASEASSKASSNQTSSNTEITSADNADAEAENTEPAKDDDTTQDSSLSFNNAVEDSSADEEDSKKTE